MARPFAGRAQPAAGVRGRAEDQGPRFECTVSALAGLARRTQRDVSRARRVTRPEAHLRDVEQGARLDVEAQQRLGRGAGRSVERARDGGRRFYRELVAVATRQTGDVRARAIAIAARGVDLDDQLVQHVVERLATERPFRQCERAVGLAVREQRRCPAKRVRGRGRRAGALDLEPGVERRRLSEAHPFEKLSTDQVVDGRLVPFAAHELAGVNNEHLGVDLDPAVALADLRGWVDRLPYLAERPAQGTERVVRLGPKQVRELAARRSARLEQQIGKERPRLVALEPA